MWIVNAAQILVNSQAGRGSILFKAAEPTLARAGEVLPAEQDPNCVT